MQNTIFLLPPFASPACRDFQVCPWRARTTWGQDCMRVRRQVEAGRRPLVASAKTKQHLISANLRTKTLDFRGLDSSIILCSRGGILVSIGDFPEI